MWIEAFAAVLDVLTSSEDELESALALAAEAAHASERTAAPLAYWTAARVELDPNQAFEAARQVLPDTPDVASEKPLRRAPPGSSTHRHYPDNTDPLWVLVLAAVA